MASQFTLSMCKDLCKDFMYFDREQLRQTQSQNDKTKTTTTGGPKKEQARTG